MKNRKHKKYGKVFLQYRMITTTITICDFIVKFTGLHVLVGQAVVFQAPCNNKQFNVVQNSAPAA